MGLRLSSVGCGYLGGAVIAFVGLGIYTLYENVSHALYYQEVQARVASVEALCAQDVDHPDYDGSIDWEACGKLADVSWPELNRLNYTRKAVLHVTFVSPADGLEHEGEFEIRGSIKSDNALRLFPGKTGMIWASDTDPADYHYDSWPFA